MMSKNYECSWKQLVQHVTIKNKSVIKFTTHLQITIKITQFLVRGVTSLISLLAEVSEAQTNRRK